MKTNDFYFDLPEELIAQFPTEDRGASRLLVLRRDGGGNGGSGKIIHSTVKALPDIIDENTVIVFNNTKVRKARIFGISDNGAKTEFLLLEKISDYKWKAISNKLKKQKPGKTFTFPAEVKCTVIEKDEKGITVEFNSNIDDAYLDKFGHMPLPPYIKRGDEPGDSERYQTIYCEKTGSAAAPTAGLHFTEEILADIKKKGATIAFITLHVGMGTFNPIHSDKVEDHVMHEEVYEINEETAEIINNAKSSGKKILAVGTTSLRTLESAVCDDKAARVAAGKGKTSLFIYPGYKFKIVDQLFTNFHTPESTLIVLVSAFAGVAEIKEAYHEAIAKKYRFFSYGDAMLIL
ncbi:MAG: tRNA preQ1(34) S-adenosylmethionine ribosyltransferase-isomerase QueA [Spirochaetes bacterium]|nr:tRNA preQ1(34) S-adenosylmethionine ribosyltransferase-isomerase QueA [Spirochaetota bacterium]